MKLQPTILAIGIVLASSASYAENHDASDIEFNFGGSIKTVLIHDSDVAGAGINIPGNTLLFRPSENSDTKIDASLSQLKFGSLQTFGNDSNLRTQVVLDFNANNDGGMAPRLREAYLAWTMDQGQLVVGQTWSTFMDMRNIPQSVAEATISGAVFKRQPLIRWTQNIGTFKYDIALETSTNDDINPLGAKLDKSGSLPALALAGEWSTKDAWVRVTSLFNELRVTDNDEVISDWGYGVQLSAGWDLTESDRITLLTNVGEGTDRYLVGLSGVGATWNEDSRSLDLRKTNSSIATYTHKWQPDLKSIFAYGKVTAEALTNQSQINSETITSTEYGMASLLWSVKPNLTLGVEYNYSQYELFNGKERDNHRVMIGLDWQY